LGKGDNNELSAGKTGHLIKEALACEQLLPCLILFGMLPVLHGNWPACSDLTLDGNCRNADPSIAGTFFDRIGASLM